MDTNPTTEPAAPRLPRIGRYAGWVLVAIATWLVFNILDAHHDWGVHLRWWGVVPYPSFGGLRFGDLFANENSRAVCHFVLTLRKT